MTAPASSSRTCPQCGRSYPPDVLFCPTDGAALRAARAGSDLTGQTIAERYHVLRKLGEGGMGQVYLAEHVRMKRKSAVKVMSPRLAHDAEAVTRFNREAENACRIQHPNVAAVYDFGETPDGLIYLAMEYVEGEPLSALVAREGALPPARSAAIVRQVGDGLAAAHRLGIVHRDLKPDNVMVARDDETGGDRAKVVDFGIAKAVGGVGGGAGGQTLTRTGLSVGTPEYMSPEQLAGDALDGRSDVYSLGLVAFNLLTGSLPFPRVTSRESLVARLTEPPKSLAAARPDVAWPPGLQEVLDRALAADPGGRWSGTAELGRALVAAAEGAEGEAARLSGAGTAVLPMPTQAPPAPAAPAVPDATQISPVAAPDAATVVAAAVATADAPTAASATPAAAPAPRRRRLTRALVLGLGGLALVSAAAIGAAQWRARQEREAAAATAAAARDAAARTAASRSGGTRAGGGGGGGARRSPPARGGRAGAAAPPNDLPAAAPLRAEEPQPPPADPAAEPAYDPAVEGAAVRADLEAAKARADAGDYVGARARLQSARARVAELRRRYPSSTEVATAEHTVAGAFGALELACRRAQAEALKARRPVGEWPRCR